MAATATPPGADGVPLDTDSPEDLDASEMTLVEHLRELRTRLVRSLLAIVVGFAIGFALRVPVFNVMVQPYCDLPSRLRAGSQGLDPDRCVLVFTDVLGGFFLSMKAAAMVAIVIAAPVVFYQIWRFVTPGLRDVERRYALPFIVISQLLFLSGAVFSYFLTPRGLEFLLGFAGENIVSLMDANRYFTFLLQAMIGFGLAFELPLILITLVFMGVLGSQQLRNARAGALFGIFVLAAVITPTQDPITMSLMALPLVLFYELSILVARLVERRRRRALVG
jgi:sec-independent protein translocase protein TatC